MWLLPIEMETLLPMFVENIISINRLFLGYILYFNYKPKEIQTDNDIEFTWNREKIKKIHPLQEFYINENIYHHRIRQ